MLLHIVAPGPKGSITEPPQPLIYVGCHIRYGFGCGLVGDRKSIENHCSVRLQFLDRIGCAGKAAASMDVKWNDRLAGKVMFIKETVHYLGEVIPPQWIAHKNRVIFIQVFDVGSQFRACIFLLLYRSIVNQRRNVAGITLRIWSVKLSTSGAIRTRWLI